MTQIAHASLVRPTVFLDDNLWENLDRTQPLSSQSRLIDKAVPTDPRDYLLREAVKPVHEELQSVHFKTVEEVLTRQFLPAFSKLMASGMGGVTAGESPLSLLQSVLTIATDQLRSSIQTIEGALTLSDGPRHIVFLIAPWDKLPVSNPNEIRIWKASQRYSNGQLGFANLKTPTRDFATKNWAYDPQGGTPASFGQIGNLWTRIHTLSETEIAHVEPGPYDETPYLAKPYVYPAALLVHLKIVRGASTIKVQSLLGLQPLLQKLDPPNVSKDAEIVHTGVPQPGVLNSSDTQTQYPMVLTTFEHNLRQPLKEMKLHLDFGVFEGYSALKRELSLNRQNNAWRMSPFLGGEVTKGKTSSYWTHLRIPVRVHLTEFDLISDMKKGEARMENLKTAIDLYDRKGGKLVPFATYAHFGLTDGEPTDTAGREIQTTANQMIAQGFAEAKKKLNREEALKKFPLASLFLNEANEGKKP